jgi:hypothetical protein
MAIYKGQTQLNRIKPVTGESWGVVRTHGLKDLRGKLEFIRHQRR